MRVLTDYHHHALAESLQMLLEDRYGWEVFFPTGMEWFTEDVWQFERKWHGDAVAKQYLSDIWDTSTEGPIRLRSDPRHPWRQQKGVTLAAAREMQWDYIISSLPDNDVGFASLARQTGATFGVQVGNNAQTSRWDLAQFILASSTLPGLEHPDTWSTPAVYQHTPCVVYHQEFDTKLFSPQWPPENGTEVASWVNCFAEMKEPYAYFARMARDHSDEFDWKCYGAYGSAPLDEWAAGDISDVPTVARTMQGARIAWHGKYWSDGFGHVIHDWFSIGRPVIGHPRYYQDKLAGPLFVEGVTSYDVEGHTADELLRIMRRLRDDDGHHQKMSEAAVARFRQFVDFGYEADVIRGLLEAVRS